MAITLLRNYLQSELISTHKHISAGNLRDVGMAVHNFHDRMKHFPFDGAELEGSANHSWFTHVLSVKPDFMLTDTQVLMAETGRQVDISRPWDDPVNRSAMKLVLPFALQPGVERQTDKNGFGLLHYAGSTRIFRSEPVIKFSDIEDGTACTLMIGEIADGFRAWGQPGSLRDPVQGIHGDDQTFGRSSQDGALFAFCDGRILFLSNKIAPDVLARLGDPADGARFEAEENPSILDREEY